MKHFKKMKINKMSLALLVLTYIYMCASHIPSAHAATTDNQVSNNGLAGYWSFNEATGTIAHDSSGNRYNGTISNPAGWATGKIGSALQFNGSNTYVTTSYTVPAQSSATSLTWSVWVKLNSSGNSTPVVILGFRNVSQWMKLTPSSFEYSNGGLMSYSIPKNQWVQITIVKNGTNFTYYANGAVVTTTTSSLTTSASTLYMGEDPGFSSDGDFSGYLDEVHIWNRALSSTEVTNLYKQGTDFINYSGAALNNGSTLNSGLVGYWTFDGKNTNWKTGITNDLSSSGNNGTLVSMSATTTQVQGKLGQALNFNGSSSNVALSTGTGIPSGNSTYTISAWIKPSSLGSYGGIVGWGTYNTNNEVNAFRLTSSSECSGGQGLWNYWWAADLKVCTTLITANAWHFVLAEFDGTTRRIYVDGIQVGNDLPSGHNVVGTTNVTIGSTCTVVICSSQGTSLFFPGSIDDVRIYNRALSANEIAQLYVLGGGKVNTPVSSLQKGSTVSSGLLAYYTFDGKNMTWANSTTGTSTDSSGNGNNATLMSMNQTINPVQGKFGQALKFNGTNNYVITPSLGTPPSSTAVSVWIKPNPAGGVVMSELGQSTINTSWHDVQIEVETNNSIKACIWTGSDNCAVAATGITYGKWYNVVMSYNSSSGVMSSYVNGAAGGTVSGTKQNTTSLFYGIGATDSTNGGNGAYFSGTIDDVRIYNRALSTSEIATLYNIGR